MIEKAFLSAKIEAFKDLKHLRLRESEWLTRSGNGRTRVALFQYLQLLINNFTVSYTQNTKYKKIKYSTLDFLQKY